MKSFLQSLSWPSAKKGVYGFLIENGDREGWVAPHCSAVQSSHLMTMPLPSSRRRQRRRKARGWNRCIVSQNDVCCWVKTSSHRNADLFKFHAHATCVPLSMIWLFAIPSFSVIMGAWRVADAEDAWFVRVNHINNYGTDPNLESDHCAQPTKPLLFFEYRCGAKQSGSHLDHIQDEPGKPCPKPSGLSFPAMSSRMCWMAQ